MTTPSSVRIATELVGPEGLKREFEGLRELNGSVSAYGIGQGRLSVAQGGIVQVTAFQIGPFRKQSL